MMSDGMSNSSSGAEALLSAARAQATSGAWESLRASLAAEEQAVAAQPELEMLLAEAELRLGEPQTARQRLLAVVPALERMRHDVLLRRALNLLGVAHLTLGDLGEAEVALE